MRRLFVIVVFGLVLFGGCTPKPIPFTPKVRDYKFPVKEEPEAAAPAEGSLFVAGGLPLFTDVRAFKPGDIITIKVDENARASRDASTDLNKQNQDTSGFDLFSLLNTFQKSNPTFDKTKLWDSASTHKFSGAGRTSRNDQFTTTVAAVVKRVLPRGSLFVEANKMVLVNNEQHHFYISGVVRPTDIEPDNSVRSALIADAQIEFNGKGDISDQQKPGWLTRLLKIIWPF
jgi:flagellar L-ring protein precursor FlgH